MKALTKVNAIARPVSLLFCLLMDLIGYANYILPGLGEFSDIVWAPISAYLFFKTFGGAKGVLGGLLNGLEEIIPFTDFIPSFTIMYFLQKRR